MRRMSVAASYQFDETKTEFARLERQASVGKSAEEALLRSLSVTPHAQILDAGCGAGLTTEILARSFRDAKILGYDIRPDFVDAARERCRGEAHVSFEVGDVTKIPRADNTFDLVYSRFLFSHLPNPARALAEVFRVARPGARVCILDVDDRSTLSFPERPALRRLVELSAKAQKKLGGDRHIGCKLPILLRDAGFSEVQLKVEAFYGHNEATVSAVDVLLRSRVSYLKGVTRKAADKELETVENLVRHGKAVVGCSVFIAIGTKK